MGIWWWILFWILFVLCAVIRYQFAFFVAFCALFITMRLRNNEMSRQTWIAFWLSYSNIGLAFTSEAVGPKAYATVLLPLAVVRLLAPPRPDDEGHYYAMPAYVFWPVLISLTPAWIVPTSRGSLIWLAVLLFGVHAEWAGLAVPGVVISWWWIMGLTAAFLVGINIAAKNGYAPAVAVFWVVVYVLRGQTWPANEDFGWIWLFSWAVLFQAVVYAFAPAMSASWYAIWFSALVGLGWAFRPDLSLARFLGWAVSIWVLRFVGYGLYMVYFVAGPNFRASLFPFNLFSDRWRGSSPQWLPVSALEPSSELGRGALCHHCSTFTAKSKLIMGSSSRFIRMAEWHPGFYTRAEFTSMFSAQANDSHTEPSCHLCCLLWHSMSSRRQKALSDSIWAGLDTVRDSSLSRPRDENAELQIRVWDERPLSLYSYMQLFWGEVAIGARLLVHRGRLFATPSPSTLSTRTDSEAHMEQAREWLTLCRESHKLCRGNERAREELPTRMLFVAGGAGWQPGQPPATLKLVSTSQLGDIPGLEYLAFSHCWGPPSGMCFKLLASNLDVCYDGIDFARLSRNVQDAITTTVHLDFSYIWIDSLCIMQRDDSTDETAAQAAIWQQDWAAEVQKMGSVYAGAACTLASTASATSSGGCFHGRSVVALEPCKIGCSPAAEKTPRGPDDWIYVRCDDVYDVARSVDAAPLNTRGWVLQERLLSRRILHFGAGMIYWECCGRTASELVPNGYTYKRIDTDFRDNYVPELKSYIRTRADVEAAEKRGHGISWANDEAVRLRPPPVMLDPDAPPESLAVWQRKRGFWKNVLKQSDEPWADDEEPENGGRTDSIDGSNGSNGSDGTGSAVSRPRAGFRAAFEQLRQRRAEPVTAANESQATDVDVGRYSFSQTWYDVVEAYSRAQLTVPTDKLIALKGIEMEVARATRLTQLYGLWREHLVTDLLWFAIEGPGRRLYAEEKEEEEEEEEQQQGEETRRRLRPVAPTWSWASIEGAVALDLLPENAREEIRTKTRLASVLGVWNDTTGQPSAAKIELCGHMLPIRSPVFDGTAWNVFLGGAKSPMARVFPDVQDADLLQRPGLFLMPFLELRRRKSLFSVSPASTASMDIQGLVLRLIRRDMPVADDMSRELDTFERVGYFTTSYIAVSSTADAGRKALKEARQVRICLAGCDDNLP